MAAHILMCLEGVFGLTIIIDLVKVLLSGVFGLGGVLLGYKLSKDSADKAHRMRHLYKFADNIQAEINYISNLPDNMDKSLADEYHQCVRRLEGSALNVQNRYGGEWEAICGPWQDFINMAEEENTGGISSSRKHGLLSRDKLLFVLRTLHNAID